MNRLLAVFAVPLAIMVAIVTGCATVGQVKPPLANNAAVVDSFVVVVDRAVIDSIRASFVADSIKAIADSILFVKIKAEADSINKMADGFLPGIDAVMANTDSARAKAEKAKSVSNHVRPADTTLVHNAKVAADSALVAVGTVETLVKSVKAIVSSTQATAAAIKTIADSALVDSISALVRNAKAETDSAKVMANKAKVWADSAYALTGKAKAASIRTKLSILTEVIKWPQPYGQVDYDQERGAILYGRLDEKTGMRTSIVFSQLDSLKHPDGLPDFIKDPDGNVQITAEGRRDENGSYVSSSFFFYHPEVEAIWDAFGRIRNLRREGSNYEGKFTFANKEGERVEVILNDLDPKQHPFGFPSFKRSKNGDLLLVANYKDGNQAVFAITQQERAEWMQETQTLMSGFKSSK